MEALDDWADSRPQTSRQSGVLDDREDHSSNDNAARTTFYHQERKADDKGNIRTMITNWKTGHQ